MIKLFVLALFLHSCVLCIHFGSRRDIHSTSQRPCMIDGNMECGALLALIPQPERSSTRRRKATTDNQEGMNAGEILALLPVAPAAKKRKTWLKRVRSNGRWQAEFQRSRDMYRAKQ